MWMSTSWPGRADAGEKLAICEHGETIGCTIGWGSGSSPWCGSPIVICAAADPVRAVSDIAIARPAVAMAERAGELRVIP